MKYYEIVSTENSFKLLNGVGKVVFETERNGKSDGSILASIFNLLYDISEKTLQNVFSVLKEAGVPDEAIKNFTIKDNSVCVKIKRLTIKARPSFQNELVLTKKNEIEVGIENKHEVVLLFKFLSKRGG